MSDETDLFAALEQRRAELASCAALFADFRSDLIAAGFSTDAAEDVSTHYAMTFINHSFEAGDDE